MRDSLNGTRKHFALRVGIDLAHPQSCVGCRLFRLEDPTRPRRWQSTKGRGFCLAFPTKRGLATRITRNVVVDGSRWRPPRRLDICLERELADG